MYSPQQTIFFTLVRKVSNVLSMSQQYELYDTIDYNRLGDGKCDYGIYNTIQFEYDRGDCCSQSCIPKAYQCGYYGFVSAFDCKDPKYYVPTVGDRN